MRKPIEIEIKGMQTPRERIWRVLLDCKQPSFTIDDIHGDVRPTVKRSAAIDYFKSLEAGGWIERTGGGEITTGCMRSPVVFKLIKRSHEAPRLTKSGQPVTQGVATLALWRCMRVFKVFDADALARSASVGDCQVSVNTAKSYIKHLAAAGYLKSTQGKGNWKLVRDTGPHAPAITSQKIVFDRNTGALATLQTAQEITDELE